MYDSSMKYKWDNKNVLDYAVNTALEEERMKVREEMKEERQATAREMIKEGMPIAQIAKFTKLSVEEIAQL
jgi:predicted transposase YdaD